MRHQVDICSCCSGDSDPICIPVWRAAGWFGVDPPHLRWDPPRRGCPRVARGACRTTGESGGRGARRTRRRPRFRSAAHRSKWHPGGTCLHLLGAAAARPQLALRRLTRGAGSVGPAVPRGAGPCGVTGKAKAGPGPSESGPGTGPGRIGEGDVSVASWPSESGPGRGARPERRGRDTKWSKGEP